jgi:proteasome lid subunit RPN8/RPN11
MDETNPGPSELERIAERYAAKKVAERTAEIVAWVQSHPYCPNPETAGDYYADLIEEKFNG